MKILAAILCISTLLFSTDTHKQYSLRLAYGTATKSDLGEILTGQIQSSVSNKRLDVITLDAGYLWYKNVYDLPVDIYIKGGFAYFNDLTLNAPDKAKHRNTFELTAYIKAYYSFGSKKTYRIGVAEGASYVNNRLYSEWYETQYENDDPNVKFLNYLELSLDADLGKLFNAHRFADTYAGWAIKHRSGIAGLINDVSTGGSNYNIFYIETNF